ncbi:AAA family ATPase [Stenomitos frigidus]|uniref:Serine/threonine protein kinase n=1 Tax=Stenomitos frigidus ULC18 TaxID=2107698 RepID=A0A2T1DWP5_9CYAN|nr:AAA family ATPase [Stenomitos frigidus]PSB24936.1 serine/threonine protein kinase [Stenomitos frigidus ULC18]
MKVRIPWFIGIREQDRQPLVFKVLKPHYPTPNELTRYWQEYEITRSLNLEGVINVYGIETYQNTLVMFLEDFGGESLRHWLTERSLSLKEVLTLGMRLAELLGQVHQQQVIHKDVNPSNLVWNPATGQLKLIDFGIASRITRETPALSSPSSLEGTLAYMSPEQTGRMNRSLDYRTDFYSLGVTLYELLTQQFPFAADDALELVHCHLAKRPLAPCDRASAIPKPVSDIVMKLLAKTAEERYQSCRSLQVDLETCLTQLQATSHISAFPLAQQDVSDRFQIPQKLYGREREVGTLLAAFERVTGRKTETKQANPPPSTRELMLIAGYSGIGKTSLVQEIYKPITQQRGYLIAGKFDQYQRDIPYTAFVDAFSGWVEQLLAEPETQLSQWREDLLVALEPNAQVMVDVIPELELILGQQSPVPELPPLETRNRFNRVFQQFIQVLAQPEHPLVVFLDDLQWVDMASLQLIQVLMTTEVPVLFLIGAYRDNEVSATHPLMQAIEAMQKTGTTIEAIALSSLHKTDIQHLLADTLNHSAGGVASLADLVLTKTDGNPFFVNEFLRVLYVEQLLTFDYQHNQWKWSIAEIQQRNITDNVVELLVAKIQRLQSTTQGGLRRAACIGNQFDLQTLTFVLHSAGVLQKPDAAAAIALLKEAVNIGLIIPLNDRYKRIELGLAQPDDALRMEYKFAHDRIQQAAYSLNSEVERSLIHRQIGQQLLQNRALAQQGQRFLDGVNQLNLSRDLIKTQAERDELARLNLVAGEKTKAATAYAAAARYLQVGLELLAPDSWQQHYDLTLTLHIAAAEAEYLNVNFERSIALTTTSLQQAKNLLDRIKVYEVQMQICMAQLEIVNVIEIGLQALEDLGIILLPLESSTNLIVDLPDLKSLNHLPIMTDRYKLAAMQILKNLCAPVFMAKPEIFPQIIITMIHLCLEHGNSKLSSFAYGFYGLLLVGFNQLETGYQAGLIALDLLEKFDAKELKAKVYNLFNSNIRTWKEHACNSITPLQQGIQSGLESGDFEWGGYCAANLCAYLFFTEESLTLAIQKQAVYIDLCAQIKQENPVNFSQVWRQLGQNFQGGVSDRLLLLGESFNETQQLPRLIAAKSGTVLFMFYTAKTLLTYHFGDYTLALQNAALAHEQLGAAVGFIQVGILNFYHSLTLLAHYSQVNRTQQKQYLEQVAANQQQMQHWTHHAPMNNQHRFDLVEAEKARVLGQDWQATEFYDRAITQAKAQGYIQEEALAYERAALFYLEHNKEIAAKAYFQEARYGYLKWGATAKVQALEERYSQLFRQMGVPKAIATNPHTSLTTTSSNPSETLDLATVIKASQALAGELNVEKLLQQLLTLVLQNAGAQTGTLLLATHETLQVEATGTADPAAIALQPSIPLAATTQVPISLIQYVARKQETLILADASQETRFANDRYMQAQQPKSVLCLPIQGHGKLIGILYLENNLTTDAFTPERAVILQALTAQAAIALENAQLYEQLATDAQTLETSNRALQQEVSDRTRAEDQLRQSLNEREVLLKEIHHRVKNNLQIISGLLQLQAQSVTDASTINILQESQHRIESMSLIHKKLYASSDFGEIDMADYIPSLSSHLLASYQIMPGHVTLQMDIAPVLLNIDQAIPCGLIVNELVSNALKYAFPGDRKGAIQIHLHPAADNQVEFIIQDNGIGLPEAVHWEYAQSMGLSLVHDLVVEQLEGSLTVERQGGTTFNMQFPLAPLFTAHLSQLN